MNGNITGIDFDLDVVGGVHEIYGIWISTAGSGVWEGSRSWRF